MHANASAVDTRPTRIEREARRRKLRIITLGHLDGRTRARKRADALAAAFAAGLGGQITDAQRLAVYNAAALTAIAEDAKARRLSGDTTVSLEDLVRLDNVAARAVKQLGIGRRRPGRPTQTLSEYLAREGAP